LFEVFGTPEGGLEQPGFGPTTRPNRFRRVLSTGTIVDPVGLGRGAYFKIGGDFDD
jgi:hypothetical protein